MKKQYEEILKYSGKTLQTIKSKRSVVVVDAEARIGFEENEHEVIIYAPFYLNHDGGAILDYLQFKVEDKVKAIDYSKMTKKELLAEAEKKGLDVKSLSRKKNNEIASVLNED